MTVKNWAIGLMNHLTLLNWGLLQAILSDCDHKFTAALWKKLFCQLHVNLMFSTAYHSQTDGSSEVTNQVAEIVLHHWLTTLKQPYNWLTVLLHLQAALNNSTKYSFINLCSNQVLFDFCMWEALNLLCVDEPNAVETSHDKHNDLIVDAQHIFLLYALKRVRLTVTDQY